MSLADDEDFAAALTKKTAELVATQVAKVKTELDIERKERKKLQAVVEELKKDMCQMKKKECQCQQYIRRAFNAGLEAVDPANVSFSNQETSGASVTPHTPLTSSTPLRVTPLRPPNKRPCPETSTGKIITNLSDVPDILKNAITPFYKEDKLATKDCLNNVQRAFIKYKTYQIYRNGEAISNTLVCQVIKEGIANLLWDDKFNPGGLDSFHTYLMNRIKNERKAVARRENLNATNELVEKYLGMAKDDSHSD